MIFLEIFISLFVCVFFVSLGFVALDVLLSNNPGDFFAKKFIINTINFPFKTSKIINQTKHVIIMVCLIQKCFVFIMCMHH